MTSLREEIDSELKEHLKKWKYSPSMAEVRDITIKVIEKKIDNLEEWKNASKDFPYEGDKEFLKAFTYGFEEALKLMRKEMLK